MSLATPRILLIGTGRFGKKHLQKLLELEKRGEAVFAGAVVRDAGRRAALAREFAIPVFADLTPETLRTVDAVDIVTPPSTHAELVRRCLPYTDVFVEKPLAETAEEAAELARIAEGHGRLLMVGHIYRFHPVTAFLKSFFEEARLKPRRITGRFINPAATDPGWDPSLDMLHFYDVIDELSGGELPTVVASERHGRTYATSLRYPGFDALLTMGWQGGERARTLELAAGDVTVKADFDASRVDICKSGGIERMDCASDDDPLARELRAFIALLKDRESVKAYPDGDVGRRIVEIAEKAVPRPSGHGRPRVAIIGAGVFGVSCALELSGSADVTVFERNGEILSEASFVNQYRHHWGYHYPRSPETVRDISEATAAFEKLYDEAIIRDFPTYYGVAKEGSKVSGSAYVRFCESHGLPFTLEYPDERFLARDRIELCLKTLEPIYDYARLKALMASRLASSPRVDVRLNSRVIDAELDAQGKKTLVIDQDGRTGREKFDYVINVTYANVNQFPHWLGFPKKEIRLDVVEALIVELPTPRVSLAVMDGPFTNLVPTGQDRVFTLVHIKESVLKRFVPSDGLVPPGLKMDSNSRRIIEKSREWFPILSEAKLLESRYVYRSVNAHREHDDARPSDIVEHGFGCWSVLGGKILNCVQLAKKLKSRIFSEGSAASGSVHLPDLDQVPDDAEEIAELHAA